MNFCSTVICSLFRLPARLFAPVPASVGVRLRRKTGNEFLFHCYLFPVPPAGLSFCAGAGFRQGAAPLETGNEFLFH